MDKLHDRYLAFGRSEITIAEMESELVTAGYADENGNALWDLFLTDHTQYQLTLDDVSESFMSQQIFSESDVIACMKSGGTPYESSYGRARNGVRIYLVKAEVTGVQFQKIGLFQGPNVLHRDRKAYKEVLRSVEIEQEKAGVTEGIALALCRARHFRSFDHELWKQIPSNWPGRTEVLPTTEDITATFDEALEISASHTRKEFLEEMQELYELRRVVVESNPPKEFTRLPKRVLELREALGLTSWISRVRWRNENQWAIGLYTEAVYWHVTGKRLELIQPSNGLYTVRQSDVESMRRAVESLQSDGLDLSKFSA